MSLVCGHRARISRAASGPPPPGIRTSSRATSGRKRAAASPAESASFATPVSCRPGTDSMRSPSAERMRGSFSQTSTRTCSSSPLSIGHPPTLSPSELWSKASHPKRCGRPIPVLSRPPQAHSLGEISSLEAAIGKSPALGLQSGLRLSPGGRSRSWVCLSWPSWSGGSAWMLASGAGKPSDLVTRRSRAVCSSYGRTQGGRLTMLWPLVYGGASAVSLIVLARLVHIAPIFDEDELPVASAARRPLVAARGRVRTGVRPQSRPRSFHLTREARSFRLAR